MSSQKTSHLKAKKISKAIFQNMVEVAGDGIFVYQDRRFSYVNPAFEQMLGYSAGELMGMGFMDVVHPSSAGLMELLCEARLRGDDVPGRYEVIFLTRNGSERNISLSPSVIDLEGRPATLNIARDITDRKVIMQELEASNQFLSSLIANSSDAIVASDLNDRALLFNKAAEEITGYSAEELLRNKVSIGSFMKAGERERIMSILDKGTADAPCRLVGEETSLYIKDGTLIPISLSVSYVYQEGRPMAAISVFRDLRPIKAVQEQLRESEQKYRILVERAQDGIFVYQDHCFKYTNPKFRDLLGYSEEEYPCMGLKDLVRPELGRMIEARYAKRIRGEKVPEQYEIALKGKEGVWRAFEITPSVIEYEGRPATQNVIRDITAKRSAEKALRASEAKYRATVEHTGTAMMMLDEDFTIIFVNHQMEKLSGYTKQEIEGRMLWTEVVHEDDVERMKSYHLARRRGDKSVPSQYEFIFVDKNAKSMDSFITIGMIPGTKQSIVSIMDLSEFKRMEKELEQARKMAILGEMSAHVAHEVRNPLQKIKTGVELLSNSQGFDERQRRLLEGVTNGIDNLEKFVTQILEWTRSGEIRPKPHRLSNIIDGLTFNLKDTFADRGVTVEVHYDPAADTVEADGIQLRQVMGNIIDNGLDAMPHGGILSISTAFRKGYTFARGKDGFLADAVEIHIQDTGHGIRSDDIERIFHPFFTKKTKGTGLGLALVRKVIDMHRGEVEAVSEEGKGAEFIIRLPRDQVKTSGATVPEKPSDLGKAQSEETRGREKDPARR